MAKWIICNQLISAISVAENLMELRCLLLNFSPSEGQYCLNIGGYSVWDVGKNLEEVRDVFEFAKKLAEKGEDAKAVFEKTEEYVVEKEKKQE